MEFTTGLWPWRCIWIEIRGVELRLTKHLFFLSGFYRTKHVSLACPPPSPASRGAISVSSRYLVLTDNFSAGKTTSTITSA